MPKVKIKTVKQKPKKLFYSVKKTKFGDVLITGDGENIYFLEFITNSKKAKLENLKELFPQTQLEKNDNFTELDFSNQNEFKIALEGTNFQQEVWQTLTKIPAGKTVSYAQVAEMMGKPKATRAVANAVAKNHLAILVPCHRVVRSDGTLGKYRWGIDLRKRILNSEKND